MMSQSVSAIISFLRFQRMTLAAFSAQPLSLDYQRIYTLARTITYKYVDVNEKFSTRPALNFLTGGNNFCAGVIRAKKFASKALR
jgi:hypothetical protein